MSTRLAIGLSGSSLILMLLVFAAYLRACCSKPPRKPPMTMMSGTGEVGSWAKHYGEPNDN